MRKYFEKLSNYYDNNKWVRIVSGVIFWLLVFLSSFILILQLVSIYFKSNNIEYDLSNDNLQIDYTLGPVTYVSYYIENIVDDEYFITVHDEPYIIDWMDYKTSWVGSNKMVLSLPNNDYVKIGNNTFYDVELIEIQSNSIYLIGNGIEIERFNKSSILDTDTLQIFYQSYDEGLDEGLKSVFDNQNLILNAEFLARGATAPDNRFFGYKIKLENDFYFSNLDIFGLNQFGSLADLDLTSNVGNVKQGIRLEGKNGVNTFYRFEDFQDNYNLMTTIIGNKNSELKYDTIIIVLASNNLSMPEHEFNHLQQQIYSKIGVYLNNMALSTEALEHYFNKYYNEGYYDAKEEQSNLVEQAYAKGKSEGYDEGLKANPNNHWSDLLFTIFGAFGTILAIEILPGWSIGIIIGIPIVFGIIYFIIGRKKD